MESEMLKFDFDKETQLFFEKIQFESINFQWKNWLQFSSTEEYKDFLLNNSRLNFVNDLWKKLEERETNSIDFSVKPEECINNYSKNFPLILCHSSGTTNIDISALKWFHMSPDIIDRYWAPGMNAIFAFLSLMSPIGLLR